eukprot:PhM_4_TR2775/c0_g2_i1/m.33253
MLRFYLDRVAYYQLQQSHFCTIRNWRSALPVMTMTMGHSSRRYCSNFSNNNNNNNSIDFTWGSPSPPNITSRPLNPLQDLIITTENSQSTSQQPDVSKKPCSTTTPATLSAAAAASGPERPQKGDVVEDGERALCAVHGMLRWKSQLKVLEKRKVDEEGGGAQGGAVVVVFRCRPGKECRGLAEQRRLCGVHGRYRHLSHLVSIAPGAYACRPGKECGHLSDEKKKRKGEDQHRRHDLIKCSLHDKPRRADALDEVAKGVFHCKPDRRCLSKKLQQMCVVHHKHRDAQYLIRRESDGKMECSAEAPCKVLCATHGKLRKATYMVEVQPGVFACRPGETCETPENTKTAMCSTHNRRRSQKHLVLDGDGAWVCAGDSPCIPSKPDPDTRVPCCVHGVMRSKSFMEKRKGAAADEWQCRSGHECKSRRQGE